MGAVSGECVGRRYHDVWLVGDVLCPAVWLIVCGEVWLMCPEVLLECSEALLVCPAVLLVCLKC